MNPASAFPVLAARSFNSSLEQYNQAKNTKKKFMSYVKPKKSLGQNFLIDKQIAEKITTALAADQADLVIEVGPGTGILTGFLLKREDIDLVAIEIDSVNVQLLHEKFPDAKDRIIAGDVLKTPLTSLSSGQLAIIGNFPYQISAPLLFMILEYRSNITEVVCMLQKEVAERIATGPGSKRYGILSVLLQAYYDIEYLFTVGPTVFIPRPRIDSAVIRLKRNKVDTLDCDEQLFFRVVKSCFNQRRKIIRNSVKAVAGDIQTEHELLMMRPEQLNVSQFAELTRWVKEQLI